MGFLIDTCIWIDVERGRISPSDVSSITGDEPVYLSPVSLAELAFGADMAADEAIRQHRHAALARLRRKPFCIIDEMTGLIFGRLAAHLRQEGRDHSYRIQDLWLASQAIQNSLKLLARNEKDFIDIPALNLVVFP